MSCSNNANGPVQNLSRTTNIPKTLTVAAWSTGTDPSSGSFHVPYSIDNVTNYSAQFYVNHSINTNWRFFSDDTGDVDLGIPSTVWTWLCCSRNNNTTNGITIYTGTGGALTKSTPAGTAQDVTSNRISLYNEADNVTPWNGEVLAFKLWSVVLTDDEVANEYLRMRPAVQMASLNTWLPILNDANCTVDWSGVGGDFAKLQNFTNVHTMPPIPWGGRNGIR